MKLEEFLNKYWMLILLILSIFFSILIVLYLPELIFITETKVIYN